MTELEPQEPAATGVSGNWPYPAGRLDGFGPEGCTGVLEPLGGSQTGTVFDPVLAYRETPPVNTRGDRLLVPGTPGALERVVGIRRYRARVQAEERILTFLERIEGLREALTAEQTELLVRLVLSIARQTVAEDRARMLEVFNGTCELLPSDQCVPDPRDEGWRRWLIGEPAGADILEQRADCEIPEQTEDPS